MPRATPSRTLVITMAVAAVGLCGGLVVLMKYAQVEIKKHGPLVEEKKKEPQGPFAERISSLSIKEHAVTQTGEDDQAHFGRYVRTADPGLYLDIVSDEVLFTSLDKLETSIGWAEFSKPFDAGRLVEEEGVMDGAKRMNVKSKTANTKLGWMANDDEGKRRYYINSSALRFLPAAELEKAGLGQHRGLFGEGAAPAPGDVKEADASR